MSPHPGEAPPELPAAAQRLAPHRDDGLLELVPTERLAAPQVALLGLAAGLVLLTAAGRILDATGAVRGLDVDLAAVVLLTLATLVAGIGHLGGRRARLDWPIPALLRLVEYGTVLVLTGGGGPAYALLATLAFHHYDIVYRVRLLGAPPPRWLRLVAGGWLLRGGLLLLAAAVGVLGPTVVGLTAVLAPVFVVEAVVRWIRDAT